METTTVKPKKRTYLYIGLIVTGVLLSAAVAYVAGSLINRQQPMAEGINSFEISDADELPQASPEIRGLVDSIDGNSLFVEGFSMSESMGTVSSRVVVAEAEAVAPPPDEGSEEGPNVMVQFPDTSGIVTEVVITHDTQIYKDVTMENIMNEMQGSGSTGEMTANEIEQQVEEGSLEDIVANSHVTIWGERTGDRVVASVVLFNNISAASSAPVQAEP